MEEERGCSNCFYEWCDERAYPCSRCIRNQPDEDMWKSKIGDNPEPDCGWK